MQGLQKSLHRRKTMKINKIPVFVTLGFLLCCVFIGSANASSSSESIACTLYFNQDDVLSCSYHNMNLGETFTAGAAVDCDRERYSVSIKPSKGLKKIETLISESGKKEVQFKAVQPGKQYIYITVKEKGSCRESNFKFTINVKDCKTSSYNNDRRGDHPGERHRQR